MPILDHRTILWDQWSKLPLSFSWIYWFPYPMGAMPYINPMPFFGGMPFLYSPMNSYPGLPCSPSPMPFASGHHPVLPQSPKTLMGTNPNGPILSPAPSNNHIILDDYFCFSHVDQNSGGILTALDKLGITHHTQFQKFQAAELEEAGMKRAHARALVRLYKIFERHLKSLHCKQR
ncbi:uncharacterized protein VP01_2572g1 [Puccinia sorghi]|uniref:Uncharacterized protein n=1 Tax=Puccinia sorghi TaxID=27349 RepID=A0A0L6V4Y2_9BASI|nr:uncharacterized protein VP01_2572g1 [Puccinia sorghi]